MIITERDFIDDLFDDAAHKEFLDFVDRMHARELHSFGIADGLYSRRMNPWYCDDADYLEGYCVGLRTPCILVDPYK